MSKELAELRTVIEREKKILLSLQRCFFFTYFTNFRDNSLSTPPPPSSSSLSLISSRSSLESKIQQLNEQHILMQSTVNTETEWGGKDEKAHRREADNLNETTYMDTHAHSSPSPPPSPSPSPLSPPHSLTLTFHATPPKPSDSPAATTAAGMASAKRVKVSASQGKKVVKTPKSHDLQDLSESVGDTQLEESALPTSIANVCYIIVLVKAIRMYHVYAVLVKAIPHSRKIW